MALAKKRTPTQQQETVSFAEASAAQLSSVPVAPPGGSPVSSSTQSASLTSFKIDPSRERYPFCVVWTPIPILSWILPMVGHVGICDSQGIIHDFAGSYFISQDAMLFGDPVKYWDLSSYIFPRIKELQVLHGYDAQTAIRLYDEAISGTTCYFRSTQSYNFFANNCHSFVSSAMEAANINRSRWNMVKVVLCLVVWGKYISIGRFLKAHLPFLCLVAIGLSVGLGVTTGSSK